MMAFDFGPDGQSFNINGEDFMKSGGDENEAKKTFLGVTTEKADGGAKITEVIEASAAEKAGLKQGDIITKIDKEKVTDGNNLAKIISGKKPKDEIKIYYKRDGKETNTKATLGERKEKRSMNFSFKGNPNNMMRSFHFPPAPPTPPNEDMVDGIPPPEVADNFMQQFERNVKVIDVDDESAAATAGLKKDDIITEINGIKINNTDDARDQLKPKEGKLNYTIKAKRNGKEMSFDVKIPKKLKTADL
jgi:serine protease Do